ncbi:MAG: hypothetical protein AB7I34_02800 [Rhizobiaceae bacterium]
MSATLAEAQSTQSNEPTQFWNAVKRWLKQNSGAAVQSAIVGALLGYALNFVMSLTLFSGAFGGTQGGLGGLLNNTIFFGILSTVFFGLIGFRRAVGKERFWQAIHNAPKNIAMLFKRDGAAARVHLLWGVAISFLAMQFISPWLGAAVAVGFLAAVPSLIGRVIAALLSRLWSSFTRSVAPTKGQEIEASVAMLVGMMGSAVALLVGGLIPSAGAKLAVAGGCILLAFMLRKSGPGAALPLILIGLAALLNDLLHPIAALADHCVRGEPGCHIPDVLRNPLVGDGDGAPELSLLGVAYDSTGGGVGAGLMAPIGLGMGWVAGQDPGSSSGGYPFGDGSPPLDGDDSFGGGPAIQVSSLPELLTQPAVFTGPAAPPPTPVINWAAGLPQAPPPPLDFSPSPWANSFDAGGGSRPQPSFGGGPDPSVSNGPLGPPKPLDFGPMGAPEPLSFGGPEQPPEPLEFGPLEAPPSLTLDKDSLGDLNLPDKGFTRDGLTAGEAPPDPLDPYGLIETGADGEPLVGSEGAGPRAPLGPPTTLDDLNQMIEENADPEAAARLKEITHRAAELAGQGIGDMDDIKRKLADELDRQKKDTWYRKAGDTVGEGFRQTGDMLSGMIGDVFEAGKDAITGTPKEQAELEAWKKRLIDEGRARGERVDDPLWLGGKIIEELKRSGRENIGGVVQEIPAAIKHLFTLDEKQQAALDRLRDKIIAEGRKNGDPVDDPSWLRARMISEGKKQGLEKLPEALGEGSGATDLTKAANMPAGETRALDRLRIAMPGAAKLGALLDGVHSVGAMAVEEMTAGTIGQAALKKELTAAAEAGEEALVARGEALKERLAETEAERLAQVKQLTADTRKPQPVGESPTPPDTSFTDAKLDKAQLDDALAGMPERNQKHVQMIADRHAVTIEVRPTNADARALLESGEGVPKPEGIKMKTITDLDIQLGAAADGAGKVGYFKPQLPEGYASVDDLPKELKARFNQRTQEFVDRKAEVERMLSKPDRSHGEPLIEVRGGIVHDKATGKPFCGDHDLFEIRGLKGEVLPQAVRGAVNKDLHMGPAQTQHDEHMGWDIGGKSTTRPPPFKDPQTGEVVAPRSDYEKAKDIDEKILKGHGPPVHDASGKLVSGGEPLVTFRANEQTGPVGEKLGGSYYTGEGRPLRPTPEEKVLLKQKGMAIEDIETMSPSDAHKALGRPMEKAHAPETPSPDGAPAGIHDVQGRTQIVQESLRAQGVKEALVEKTTYKPFAPWEADKPVGAQGVRGHVDDFKLGEPTPGAEVHSPAFEEKERGEWVTNSRLTVDRVAYHEGVTHPQQYAQLQTQAAPGGPLSHLVEKQGEHKGQLTLHDPDNPTALTGQAYLERDAHMADLDRMLKVKQDAILKAARTPAQAEQWLARAAEAEKEISHARAALKGYGVSGDRPVAWTKEWKGWARPDDETLP